MNEYTVTVTIQADDANDAKGIVERGIDKQGLAVVDISTEQKLVVTIWNAAGDDTSLIAELDRYEINGAEEQAYYVGTLKADYPNEDDPKVLEYIGRTVNVHLPL